MIENKIFLFDLKNILRDKKTMITVFINLLIQLLLCFSLVIIKLTSKESILEPLAIYITENYSPFFFLINYIYPVYIFVLLSVIPFVIGLSLVSSEKEMGTLESLLYLPIKRRSIFYTKIICLFIVSYCLSLICVLTQLIIFVIFSGPQTLDLLFWIKYLLIYLPFWIAFISSIITIISTISKTTKEANQFSLGFCFALLILVQGSTIFKINIFSHYFFLIILVLSVIPIIMTLIWIARNLQIEKILFRISKY